VHILHRYDIGYVSLVEASATSPIILSHRAGDVSIALGQCLELVAALNTVK
jgi:hypothetical protein